MKKVQVNLSDETHAVLKAYASFFGKTMSEILYMYTVQELHQQAIHCKCTKQLLDGQSIKLDKRVTKDCWGYKCVICKHATACQCGLTEEKFHPIDRVKQFLREESEFWEFFED